MWRCCVSDYDVGDDENAAAIIIYPSPRAAQLVLGLAGVVGGAAAAVAHAWPRLAQTWEAQRRQRNLERQNDLRCVVRPAAVLLSLLADP